MKRRTKSKNRHFDYLAYLKEIELALPAQQDPARRAAMCAARDFILGNFPETNTRRTASNLTLLPAFIHSLQCCGISPKGCPPPIKPRKGDRIIMIPISDCGTHSTNGGAQ